MGAGTQRISVPGWGPRTVGRSALFALILIGAAIGGSAAVIAVPDLALALPVLVISTALALRYPAGMTIGTFFLTGTLNVLTAYTPVPVGPLVDVMLAGLVFSVLYRWATGRVRPGRMIWAPLVPLAIYVVFTLAQTILSDGLWFAIQGFRASTWYIVALFVIAGAGWSRETYERIARGIVVVALAVGAYAAVRWVIGPGSAERALAVSQAKDYNFVDGQLRLFGSFTSGGELAAWVAPTICVCAFYAVAVAGRWRRLAIAACVLCTVGLLGSENRTALVAIALGLTLAFVVFQLSRGLAASRLSASAALLVGVVLIGGTVFMFTIAGSPGSVDRYK